MNFRCALATGVHLAAADLRADGDLHELHGAHLVDADGVALEDHAIYDGGDRPHESGEQFDPRRHDGGDCVECGQSPLGYQARLHARSEAAATGHRSRDWNFRGGARVDPAVFLLFLPPNSAGVRSVETIVSDQFAMPGALQWKGVADLIAKGVSNLPPSAIISMIVAAVAAVAFEVLRIKTKGDSRFQRCRWDWAWCCRRNRVSRCGSAR